MSFNQHSQSPYGLIDDTSIFIGLTSLPMGKERLFNKEILELVKKHKNRTLKYMRHNVNNRKSEEFKKLLYNPKTFYTFGSFDLALLSLIDDFEFCTQAFHPFDPMYPTDKELKVKNRKAQDADGEAGRRHFAHHLLVGPAPCWNANKNEIIRLAEDTFISGPLKDPLSQNSDRSPLPMFGICQLKLNNGILIGSGSDFLRCAIRAIKKAYDEKYRKNDIPDSKFQIIILESWSWHEITLLFFSDSYTKIIKFVIELCEMTVETLDTKFRTNDYAYDKFKNTDWLIKKIIEKKKLENRDFKADFFKCHLFWNSTTTLGFRFEIFDKGGTNNTKGELQLIDSEDYVYPFSRWHSKAGHEIVGIGIMIPQTEEQKNILICTGRDDIVWPCKNIGAYHEIGICRMQSQKFIDKIVEARTQDKINNHFISTNTIISLGPELFWNKEGDLRFPPVNPEVHFPLFSNEVKKHLTVKISDIRKNLYKPIRMNLMPKVVSERIYNTIALFNEGVDDPFLLNSFLELFPFVETIKTKVKMIVRKGGSIIRATKKMNELVELFNKAWRNRYYGSYRLCDISDFNLEYKGGIQQLVSAFDGAYKILSWSLTNKYDILTIISGDPRIYSTPNSIELNYYDIFMPEFFVARATHEAGETFLMTSIEKEEKIKKNEFYCLVDKECVLDKIECCSDSDKKVLENIKLITKHQKLHLFFSDVYGDTCARRLTYGEDIELFIYWYRNMALADCIFWLMPKKYCKYALIHNTAYKDLSFFRVNILKIFLIRIFLQVIMAKPEENEKEQIDLVSKYWIHYPRVTRRLLINLREFAFSLYNCDFIKKGFVQMNETISSIVSSWPSGVFITQDKRKYYKDNLMKGAAISAEPKDFPLPFHFLQFLFRTYLQLIKEVGSGEGNENKDIDPLLYRFTIPAKKLLDVGKPLPSKKQNKILYDRRGGTFLTDPETRRKYFRLRSAFIMSLWDMVAKWKFWMPELNKLIGRQQ